MTVFRGRFPDLLPRILSAAVLIAVGLVCILAGGAAFLALVAVAAALMMWELARMIGLRGGDAAARLVALAAGATVVAAGFTGGAAAAVIVLLAPVAGTVLARRFAAVVLVYGAAVMLAVLGLVELRAGAPAAWTFWLVSVVAAADIGGYFFGRVLGGPKILPRISPKKTWAGTLGGWLVAALVAAAFVAAGTGSASLLVTSVLAAIASQAGDVAESAIKRRCGVKDSSHLSPGHGGLLDRFDALAGASLFVWLIGGAAGLVAAAGG